MKTLFRIAVILITALTLVSLLPSAQAAYGGVYNKTVRFHVLANSDGEEDQALKLRVRDELVAFLSPILQNCESASQSGETICSMLGQIENKTKEILENAGSDLDCKVVFGKEFYPARDYGNLSYPAGEYNSLRVFLGKGEGKNWWCVLFPPLCIDSSETQAGLERAGYTEEEQNLVTKKDAGYKVRFFLLDLAAKLKNLFS